MPGSKSIQTSHQRALYIIIYIIIFKFLVGTQNNKILSHKWWDKSYDLPKKPILNYALAQSQDKLLIMTQPIHTVHQKIKPMKTCSSSSVRKVLCHTTPHKGMDTSTVVMNLIYIQTLHSLQSVIHWLFKILSFL